MAELIPLSSSSDGEPDWKTAALARLADARTRNRRLGHRKSRGGCRSCKSRRIKCDETYPECLKCTKSGRHCDGYNTPSPTSSDSSMVSWPSSPPNQYSTLSNHDRRPFDFFLARAAPKLGGPFDQDFWSHRVLQLAHVEPYVRDCVLAISILYEHPQYTKSLRGKDRFFDLQTDGVAEIQSAEDERALLPPFLTNRHAEALRYYNRAIAAFRERLADGSATPALALLSCILFACIDVIRDHMFGALDLITQGARIIHQHGRLSSNSGDSELMSALQPTVHRMSVLSAIYGFTTPLNLLPRRSDSTNNNLFISVEDARDALFTVLGDINLFIWEAANTRASYEFSPLESCISPRSKDVFNMPFFPKPAVIERLNPSASPIITSAERAIFERSADLNNRLTAWFTCLHNSHLLNMSAISGLLMYYHASYVLLQTHLHNDEMLYDNYTYNFQAILNHAETYINANAMQRSTFTFETGAVAPLHVLADKCRVPSMRRKALQLIDLAPRKENMWGAAGVAQLCARIIAVEEEGLGLPVTDYRGQPTGRHPPPLDDTKIPPEENRAHYLELLRDASGEFEVRITRLRQTGSGQLTTEVRDYAVCD